MITGVLIIESLRYEVTLDGLKLHVDKITRWPNPNPAPGQSATWTIVEFTSDRDDPTYLVNQFTQALSSPGWYVDLHTETEKYVIFPSKTFIYHRGDPTGRAEAISYAQSVGVPENQCDWSE